MHILKKILILIFIVGGIYWYFSVQEKIPSSIPPGVQTLSGATQKVQSGVSEKVAKTLGDTEVQKTLSRIKKDDGKYQKDGATFMNRERRLPVQKDRSYYQEWTVTTPGGRDRGARRIIVGKAGEIWFTDDHYETFVRIE